MLDTLYKLLPIILALAVGELLYLKLDENNRATDIINFMLPMPQRWKPSFSFYFTVTLVVLISVFGLLTFKLSSSLCFIINGFVIGFGIGITDKLSKIKII